MAFAEQYVNSVLFGIREVTRVFEIASLREGMMHGVELFQLLLEIISIACVVIGLGKTLWLAARVRDHQPGFPRIRLCFGSWLILALEFQLAADILATTVAPSKEEPVSYTHLRAHET